MMSTVGYYIFLVFLGCATVSQGLALGIQNGDIAVPQSYRIKSMVTDTAREKRGIDNTKSVNDNDENKKIYTKLLQSFVNMYRHKNVTGEKENEDDFFCVSDKDDKESYGARIDQVDIPAQLFNYLTKYIVKRSYTPFTYIKGTLETFGVINPIDNVIHKKEFSVIDDPMTMLFTNMQQVYNSYEEVEREEESTKLLDMLARSSADDIKKSGIISKLWPATKPKPDDDDDDNKKRKCVLKKPGDLWDEIMPYDPYIIIRSLLAAGVWLFAFWVPIFPFIFSFPSRNGLGGFTPDGNRRDHETYDYYDSQYSTYEGNYTGFHSDNQAQPYHVNHDNHLSHSSYASDINNNGYQAHGEASHSSLGDIVQHHISNSHKVAGTQNVFVSNGKSVDGQEVSSYTHYNSNNIWYNHL